MSETLRVIPSQIRHRIFAEQAVKENLWLAEQYLEGKRDALIQLVEYAVSISLGNAEPRLVGECIVLELMELHRSRLKAKRK